MTRLPLRLAALCVLVIAWPSACAKPAKRFAGLQLAPAQFGPLLDPCVFTDPASRVELEQAILGAFSRDIELATRRGDPAVSGSLIKRDPDTGCPSPTPTAPSLVANVSPRRYAAAPGPGLFFEMSPQAQAETIRLYSAWLESQGSPDDAGTGLNGFLDRVSSAPAGPASQSSIKVEFTFSHLLASPVEWDRLHAITFVLIPHDPEVRVVDTNQIESLLKELEVGTLTTSSTLEAGIGGKATAGSGEVTPSLSYTYSQELERKLKEQLQLRAPSIEQGGRLFRLSYKSSVEHHIPSMFRQVLSLRVDPPLDGTIIEMEAEFDDKGTPARLATAEQPALCFKRTPSQARDMLYRAQMTPIVLALVRRVTNIEGARTPGFDDDDRVTLEAAVGRLPAVTAGEFRIRHYQVCQTLPNTTTCQLLFFAKRGRFGLPADVRFRDREQAEGMATLLRERITALREKKAVNRLKEGDLLEPAEQKSLGPWRLGVQQATAPCTLEPGGCVMVGGAKTPAHDSSIRLDPAQIRVVTTTPLCGQTAARTPSATQPASDGSKQARQRAS